MFFLIYLIIPVHSSILIIDHSNQVQPYSGQSYKVKAFYNNTVNQTGWAILNIQTNPHLNDQDQFYYAGYLEGYLTYDLINHAYQNFAGTILKGNPDIDETAQLFIDKQLKWIQQQCLIRSSSFWNQVCNLIQQLRGMYQGYSDKMKHTSNQELLDFNHFYYLTNMGDLEDIIPGTKLMSCNSYIKFTKNKDLLVGHNTFNIYSLMLRIYKTYKFSLHDTSVQANLSFSSRPGDLESKDDFYKMSESKMVVVETSLNNWNATNYQYLHPDSLPTWIRVTVANRLASNGIEWAELFQQFRSGTHNNQWLVVDYKNIEKLDNIVILVEESFYLFKVQDFTNRLLQNSYIASYNIPYDKEIFERAQYEKGYKYDYYNDPRAIQFKEFSQFIDDRMDIAKVIRINQNTTYNLCDQAISPRCDKITDDHYTFGGIDGILNQNQFNIKGKQDQVMIISSPSYQDLEAFTWDSFKNTPHYGMQDEWRFPWYTYDEQNFSLEFLFYE